MIRTFGACAALLCCALSAGALAQSFPSRPIRFIVASPPGGSPDILARLVAQKLGESLGQQVVVDNRSGASGVIGTELAARAAPDGHTWLLMTSTLGSALPNLRRKLPFDIDRDFTHVVQLAFVANVLVANATVPAKSVADLVQLAKARGDALTFPSAGIGSPAHLAGEMFNVLAGTRMTHVPYKGAGPAVIDLVAGQVHVMFGSPLVLLPHVKSGKLRALATTGTARGPVMPELPPVADTLPGFSITQWWGISLPSKTPADIVQRLNGETAKALALPDVRDRIVAQGGATGGGTPAAFTALIASERIRLADVIRKAKIPVED